MTEVLDTLHIRSKLKALLEESVAHTPKELARDLAKLAYEADHSTAAITVQGKDSERAIWCLYHK